VNDSSPSRNPLLGTAQDYTDPQKKPTSTLSAQIDPYREDGDQHAMIEMAYRGKNYALPKADTETGHKIWTTLVPDLDVTNKLDLHVDRTNKKLRFACRMTGDGFPNAESFLLDASDQPLFLVTHRRVGSATGQLYGNRKIAMASSSAHLDFPDNQFGSALEAAWCLDYASHTGGPIDVFEETGSKPSSRSAWNEMHTKRDARGDRVRRWWLDNDVAWASGRSGSSMP
jgi:hypothetical protein